MKAGTVSLCALCGDFELPHIKLKSGVKSWKVVVDRQQPPGYSVKPGAKGYYTSRDDFGGQNCMVAARDLGPDVRELDLLVGVRCPVPSTAVGATINSLVVQ